MSASKSSPVPPEPTPVAPVSGYAELSSEKQPVVPPAATHAVVPLSTASTSSGTTTQSSAPASASEQAILVLAGSVQQLTLEARTLSDILSKRGGLRWLSSTVVLLLILILFFLAVILWGLTVGGWSS